MKRRVLSFTIALALCLDLLPVGAFAADLGTGDGLCPHHTEHTDTCGYAPPVLEQECTHSHDDGCYTVETHCIHEHTSECYPPDPADGSEAGEPVLCAHTCTQESGCVTQVLSCPHVHDGACGYVKGDPGAPCTFVCPICPIEDLIGKLPGSVSEDNCEQVQAQLDEIYARYDELSADEQQQVDLSPCAALLDQVEGMGAAVMGSAPVERDVLNEDFTFITPYEISRPISIDTNEHTITGSRSNAISVTGTGELYLIGIGSVISQKGAGVEVQSGGLLNISGEGMAIKGTTYALTIASGAHVTLSAGTYSGTTAAIRTADGDLSALLAPGCAYFDANGNVVPTADLAQAKTLVVKQCTSHSKTYGPNAGSPTHSWTCAYCGTTETQEKCEFTFDQSGKGTCSLCGNEIAVDVDRNSLKVLAYDDTVQPANGTVTVMVKDAATALTEDTDYAVSYSTRAEVGSTDITVTVTVTGKTYEGTFKQDYTFTKDELTKPVLEWDGTSASVPYTGDPVTKDLLPTVTINIQTGSGVDLHDLLQYSYRAAQGSDAYTAGLPTNAGIYDVVVSLSEGTDYQAASSEPITLTVEPIHPIVTPPAPARPIYDRTAQELVTAGELDPVAVADGLEIQFATEENGPYSTTIPTGTDAGSYTVWYRVAGLTGNYIAPVPHPAEIGGVVILRKSITPVVELEYETCLYDGGFKQPKVTVKDVDHVTILLNTEYQVGYRDNRDVGTAKAVVTDRDGGNYAITTVEAPFQITQKPQDTLSITQKPDTVTYGDRFTLSTTGGSGSGDVTWAITDGADVAKVDAHSGQVTVIGHGSATVKATKSGAAPTRAADGNYEDATASWTFNAVQRPVTAIVTAEDKAYDGNNSAKVHAVVEDGVLAGDEIVITGLTGTFDNKNAGADKPVTVVTTGATITGNNSQHYAITYSSLTVQAAIHKAVVDVTAPPVPASLTYNGTAQVLIGTGAVVGTTGVDVEYALSEDGPYSTDFPKGTDAGTYTVWYRVKETDNYTGSAPASVDVTIAKKPVLPVIELDQDSFTYDGTEKEPAVTLYEDNTQAVEIPAGEYTVAYSGNINVGTATVTVKAKDGGNYSFTDVTAAFTISQKQAQVVTAPEAAGRPLFFANYDQRLVTAGTAEGGTMVYSVGDETGYSSIIPERTNAGTYTVYYKVQGDANHSDSAAGHVEVTIAPKTVKDPTIELKNDDGTPFVSCTYNGTEKRPTVVVKDGSDTIGEDEYEIVYSNNKDAGTATISITDKPNGNYTVTGSTTFVINKADIVFNPAPSAANLTYNGTAQELLVPGTTTGGTVQYALNSATSTFADAIPTGVNAGTYNVYYKVTGDKNHNDLPVQGPVAVTIARKQLTDITIELAPDSFQYDGKAHLPAVAVKDGDTVLPASEYSWKSYDASGTNEVIDPKDGGTYTIIISDKTGGNYDLTKVTTNTATFSIGKAAQAELVIEGKPEQVYYGGTFKLTTTGGSGTGTVTWNVVTGPATVDTNGNVAITGVGEVTITAEKAADTNYAAAQAQLTFTAAPKPVTAAVTVNDKSYDGTTAATVASAGITADLLTGDTVTIDLASITAAFDDSHVGTGKTVTLDTSKVKVTGDDAAKYAISYPGTVTAEITKATTTITTAPAAIAPLTYSGQPQALVTAGKTNVGFLVYSLDGTSFSSEIPTGTNARTYTVYYKVDETGDYTGVAANGAPISVTIAPKPITPKVELSQSSFLYDGTKKEPKITVKDGDTVLCEDQDYTVAWANEDPLAPGELLTAAGSYKATIENVVNGNYAFTATAKVEIKAAVQEALNITGTPDHVYYGDTIATLKATGGSGNGTVTWSITDGNASAQIDAGTGALTVKGTGSVTVKAERTVPNYAPATGTWTFTVEPKPVVAEVTVRAKDYDGTTDIADSAITATVKAADLVNGDTVTISGLTGVYADANAGTGKLVTLDSTGATADNTDKYAVSYPAAATGDINPRQVTVTVTLSGNDLKTDTTDGSYYYDYDGADKTPTVTVTGTGDGGYRATLAASDYDVAYTDNKNVGDATVTVTAKAGGNYTFDDAEVKFAIRKAGAVLTSSPQAKDLTYTGKDQELVTVGTATGGTVVYSLSKDDPNDPYLESIPKKEAAGTYIVYYKVKADGNHTDTEPAPVSVTIKPKTITPAITLSGDGLTETNGVYSYTYDGNPKTPTVTVKDGTEPIGAGEYSVSYRDNVNAGTATVVISDKNGGNYIVNGSVTFAITKADPIYTPPTAIGGLQYNGELQDLVKAGISNDGTVVYSVNGGNYFAAIPTASAVGTYTISWKVVGDANHSDTAAATLTVTIAKNTVDDPTITLSQDQFTYDGNQHKPTVTVYDKNSRPIPAHEYTVSITPKTSGNTSNMVDVDTYTVTVTTPDSSNYVISGSNTREFKIVPADQETISMTGTKAQVRYGDEIQLGVSGGTGSGTVTWKIEGHAGTTLTQGGLLTVKDVNTPIKVTVTRSRDNYGDVSATWEFTAAKKPVTAVLTGVDRDYIAGNKTATVTASVPNSELVSGDSITISGLTGEFDDPSVGTDKKVTVNSSSPTVTGTNWEKYDITYPAATTASILAVAATVDTAPKAVTSLTYDASQAQELVTAGDATGGTMAYSLDGVNFTPNIPKAKNAGTYKVYYKAQGDSDHTDSAISSVDVTIDKQTIEADKLQIELSPPSAQYDGNVHQPAVTLRDKTNNVIPDSEYKVTYVSDGGANWKDQDTYKVKVEDITGGNYVVSTKTADFTISTSAQAPLEIVGKPGVVHYGDTFTLSATGGSSSRAVTWSSSNENIAHIDANGLVTIKGVGQATITATKAGGGNYEEATATYPLNALKKPVMAIVTAEDREYKENDVTAKIHVTWEKGALVGTDRIDTAPLSGIFADDEVGTGKTVTISGTPVSDATSQKYDITIPSTTTASITKATAAAPNVTAVSGLTYTGSAQTLVSGDANTLYSTSRDGVYSTTVPAGTNAGTYTVWYKAKGDDNYNESEPQSISVTISPKALTAGASNVELSGNDLNTETAGDDTTYYYEYDGTEKTPSVIVKDGAAPIPASEYTVTYSGNKSVGTATVTITDNEGGNYTVSGSVTFEIRKGGAQLTSSPQARDLTYTGQPQELVTVGTATGGHLEYAVDGGAYSADIPKADLAKTYTVTYKVVGDGNHEDDTTVGSVTVTIKPKTVISPKITVDGGSFTYTGNVHEPTVTVVDGTATIDAGEYTLSYQNNVNAGTATVIVRDNNGGNYTVNGTATFEIGKATAAVGTAPTGKTGLPYNGTEQALIEAGSSADGTMVYSLAKDGEYSAAIPTGKAVGSYTVWYKVLGDSNHTDSASQPVIASIAVNNVTRPTIQVTPDQVTYNGEKQTPTVTVRDNDGLLIDGSEYKVTYVDNKGNETTDPTAVGTYTLTIAGVADGRNYTFNIAADVGPVTFTITPADQSALTITGTRERVYYGDTIQLGATGGISGGTVTWKVNDGAPASINKDTGLLTITGVGSVTVTATSSKTGYADQTATWTLYAEKKQVTAVVTAQDRTYTGDKTATLSVTWKAGDLVGSDNIGATSLTGEFTDANVGANKTVKITGTLTHANYDITVPPTTTASIFKADVTDVTPPDPVTDLKYTGLPQALVTAGSSAQGTLEYSLDGLTYSASLPTGTDAGSYDVWYRVKGDGNHNDTAGTKLTSDTSKVTIGKQTVDAPTIEFNPTGASYDGQEHRPEVTVKDAHGRTIPAAEYTVSYGSTNWKDVGDHTVTITGRTDGNYSITGTPSKTFTILPAGQSPLSIVGQPGRVQYGSVFTLSTNGGSGTGTVTWASSDDQVASVNSQTGRVEILKAGGPVTITARKAAGGGYGETTATWTFSAEKKPVTPIVTAMDKVYDATDEADLVITWKDGDLLGNDSIAFDSALTGKFSNANVGDNKTVTITGAKPTSDKYDVTIPSSTTASITPKTATVTGVTAKTDLVYDGRAQELVSGGTATGGTVEYSLDGSSFSPNIPKAADAGSYTVWYKAVADDSNHADSARKSVLVTIDPKPVVSPNIELSPTTFDYDGTAKKPDVVVKDGNTVISPSEYTVSYSNNIAVSTNATVTITDVAGGNYTVNGSATFTIKAGTAALKEAPQPRELTYTGAAQTLVTAGSAVNGRVVYSLDPDGAYSASIPRGTNAGDYEVWYKVQGDNGADDTQAQYVTVTIQPKEVTPTILLNGQYAFSATYTGSAIMPTVTVNVGGEATSSFTPTYSNNTKVGTATVTVQSTGGNYKFFGVTTFEITKGKATFSVKPTAKTLEYTGEPQKLVTLGLPAQSGLSVVYSTDGYSYLPAIPTATDRGDYLVIAKVQGNEMYEDSELVAIPVEVKRNTVANPIVNLSASSMNYTGSELKPAVTVIDKGATIPASEYTVSYSDNINKGTATVTVTGNTNNYTFFTATVTFQIVDASQPVLTITGKPDRVRYGDTIATLRAEGAPGAVTWSVTGTGSTIDQATGRLVVKDGGAITVTATSGSLSDSWTFTVEPKPVTAVVTAASKPYDGGDTATLTVTISNGLVPGDSIPTNTDGGVKATGRFADASVGENKTVVIDGLTIPAEVSAKYDISWPSTTTASITPKTAEVTAAPTPATGPLTYNGGAQALLASGGTAATGGNLMYSLDGRDYSYSIPEATDAGTYTIWYKAAAADENHKDSAPAKLGPVTIGPYTGTLSVLCTPDQFRYDGTVKTPTVVVRDDAQRILPESEYTVTLPAGRIAVDTYTVTVTDRSGGNYNFTNPVTGTFEIVSASQDPLSIITDIPTNVHYGDTFRLSAMGGSGGGAIQWSIEGTAATINDNGVVTVTGIGGFTVEAYREGADGYSDSNTASVPFVAKQKPVTPVVTVKPKNYDGIASIASDAITVTVRSSDLVSGDSITINGLRAFYDSANAGTGKTVTLDLTSVAVGGTNADRYVINWPDSVTGTIDRVNAKLKTAPAGIAGLKYTGDPRALVTAGSTVGGIGTIEYSTSQNGAYSTTIPTGTNAGTYKVWYRVEDSVNYMGIPATEIEVEIKKATPTINTNPTASGGVAGDPLSKFSLGGAATDVNGTFAWADDSILAVAGQQYDVIFTPDDTANYETVTFTLTPVSAPSSDSGTSGTNTTPPVETVSDSTQTTIRDGTANTVLSASDGDQLVKEAVKDQSDTIVIKPEIAGDVTKTQVSIPASTVSQISSQTDAALTVASPIADVTIPNGALNTLSRAGGTVNVVTEQVGGAVALTLTADGKTVEDVPGGVTLTVPAQDAGAGTVAVLVHDDGTREVLQRSVVKDGKLSAPLSGSATVEIVDNGKSFADVPDTDWAAEAVTFASARELFNGTSETTFSPDGTTSRGMVATVLYRLEGQPDQALTDVYNDVSDDAWYADSVAWAAENGIVNGYGDGQFGPNDSVTREQFVVMLWRYLGSPEANDHDLAAFTDADQINSYAREALCWAVENGVLKGNGGGQLIPGGTATRAEAAQMLKNFIENT